MCYVGDACTVWNERVVRAARPHKCDECWAPIPAGVRYARIGSLFDGSWETHRVHWECLQLWYTVRLDLCGGEGLIVIGGLDEELREYDHEHGMLDESGEEALPTAAEPYRARLQAIRAKYQEAAA